MMHIDNATACRAGPSLLFGFDELLYARIFDIFKIFDHTHGVFCPIPFIDMFYSLAGELCTGKTKILIVVPEFFAVFYFACYAGFRFCLTLFSATGTFFLDS